MVFGFGEGSSERRPDAEERKEVPGTGGRGDYLRQFTSLAGEVELPPAPRGHVLEAVSLSAPVVVVGGRDIVVVE